MINYSIIIPAYNVRGFLKDCVLSVIQQNYKEIEIILIDDGSTDGTSELCDKLSKRIKNVRVFHKKNGGASSARNFGIQKAKGKYLFFLDADDIMKKNILIDLEEIIRKDKSLIMGRYKISKKKGKKVKNYFFLNNNKAKIFCENFVQMGEDLPWRPYQLIVKRSLLKSKKISFDLKYKVGEDFDFFMKLINNTNDFFYTSLFFVEYRKGRSDSLVNTFSYENVMSQLLVFKKYFKFFKYKNQSSILKEYVSCLFVNAALTIGLINDQSDRKKCFYYVEQNKSIFKSVPFRKKWIFIRILTFSMGIEKGLQILSICKKIKNVLKLK